MAQLGGSYYYLMFTRMSAVRAVKRLFSVWTVVGLIAALCFALPVAQCEDILSTADETISRSRGESAELFCPFDIDSCGELHSIKWFKDGTRIAVVAGSGSFKNIETGFKDKVSVELDLEGPWTKLQLKSLQVPDEGTYVCETTFIEPSDNCTDDGRYTVQVNVLVPPNLIQIVDESNTQIQNSSLLGPLREGHKFSSICEVRGTRPAPSVFWYRGDTKLTDSSTTEERDGLFTVKSVLSLVLSRQELGAFIECRVETPALDHPVSNLISIDLQVRPTKIEIGGFQHHTVQGSNNVLECLVTGARPAANITWYNNTIPLDPFSESDAVTITTKPQFKNDGTYETLSKMEFKASRFENGVSIRCEADNIVMRDDSDKPLHETIVLEVMYPPVVTVTPDNITATEGGEFLLFCEYEANPASLKQVRWLLNGELIERNHSRFEGGNPEQTALLIKETSRHDAGSYTCELENSIGLGSSENDIDVEVFFVPTVEVLMVPDTPVIEDNLVNVTLICSPIEGNPRNLTNVMWYHEGDRIQDVPECPKKIDVVNGDQDNKNANEDDDGAEDNDDDDDDDDDDEDDDDEDECGIYRLYNVERSSMGNYSCAGENQAGWGPRSEENDLVVYFEPGNATLVHEPKIAIKKKSVTLTCSVEDGGNPNATRFRWLRGETPIMDVVTPVWTIDPVGLESRTNFSCYAYNEGGSGNPAIIQLDVHAPQTFLQKLAPYTGVLYTANVVSLACRVECVPACKVDWYRDNTKITSKNPRYFVLNSEVPPDPALGEFESILSVLHFNMTAWPGNQFDWSKDNANYSCSSSSIAEGPGVRSTTMFAVEYPPQNTSITNTTINVEEDMQPARVSCSARAFPEATYEWRRNDKTVSKGSVLTINQHMTRADNGATYECIATNKHGSHEAETTMNVMYKPNCTIVRKELNEEDTLICMLIGYPSEITFEWTVQIDNETELVEEQRSHEYARTPSSFLVLGDDFSAQRTYRCVPKNDVGEGEFCEIAVAGHLMWWQVLDPLTLYILLALAIALLLLIIIVIIICCCMCRKRRKPNKLDEKLPSPGDSLADNDTYENLPFHGMQSPPNKPLGIPDLDDLEYADVDFRSYGPINYKAASIYALVKKNKGGALLETKK